MPKSVMYGKADYIAKNVYGYYCIPRTSAHRYAARTIIDGKIHEPETIDYILDNAGEGDIVHAGAYFGDFLPALSTGITASSKIWAFEPNPENYLCAQKTLKINQISNVNLHNLGLGAKRDNMYIQITDEHGKALGGASRISSSSKEISGRFLDVEIWKLDEIIPKDRNVSIIHLDVEGMELQALMGGKSIIERCHPKIILEILPDSNILDCPWFRKKILEYGYRQINTIHRNHYFEFLGEYDSTLDR